VNVVVEKLTGRDVAGLYEASILLKHEARQAVGAPPFEDGFKCPSCGHQIVRNSDEKQLELLAEAETFKQRQDRILKANGDGVVQTPTDTASLPWEPAAGAEPADPPIAPDEIVPAEPATPEPAR
jgi:hypothetical protein